VLFEFDDAAHEVVEPAHDDGAAGRPEMGDLSGPQRTAAMGLLAATLSQGGYDKAPCDSKLQSRV